MGCRLWLDDENFGVYTVLKLFYQLRTSIDRHVSIDNFTGDAMLGQVFLKQLNGVGERNKHQHLVARFVNDFLHHVQTVRHVKL